MAKKHGLGSGSKGRTASGEHKLGPLGIPNQPNDMPWVDPTRYEQQTRVGVAGNMLRSALSKSKSTGMKVPK